jgi:hypothetical protein
MAGDGFLAFTENFVFTTWFIMADVDFRLVSQLGNVFSQ